MPENLSELFDKDVRPFMDAIDNLRCYGLDEDLHLPTVVVIGDQSSGKSSILEAISGIQLPRGQGMVTRCPLQLQMKKAKTSENPTALLTYMKGEDFIQRDLSSLSEVDSAVREAQDDVTESSSSISDTLLTLTIVSSDVPDLTLVDLPGIARMNVKNQDIDIYQQIVSLLQKYISREEVIILAVCPCTTDIETSEALKLAHKFDPGFQRTYGVLTKADLVDKGSEDTLFKIINNEVLKLSKGFILVKCRGQQALNNAESLKDALNKERDFFRKHHVFRKLNKSEWGINTLSRKLSTDLINFIKKEFPNIRRSISQKLKSLTEQNNKLILAYPTTPDARIMFVTKKTTEFLRVLHSLIEGKYDLQELDEIEKYVKRRNLTVNIRIIPHIRREINNLERKLVKCSPDHSLDTLTEEILTENQGKEPMEFLSYHAFKKLALIFVEKIRPHIEETFENIYKNFSAILDVLTHYYFGKYPVLLANLRIVISDTLTSMYDNCNKDLTTMLDKEKICFILDKTYEEKMDSLMALQNPKYTMKSAWMSYFQPKSQHQNVSPDNRKQLPKYIAIYYIMAINRISEQVPSSILLMLMNKFYEKLNERLIPHVIKPKTYDLIEKDCSGIKEKKITLDSKIKGLRKGITEIDRINFDPSLNDVIKSDDEDL